MDNIIELELKAIDFKNTSFYNNCDCAISKAVKRQMGALYVFEDVFEVDIDDIIYDHKEYHSIEFRQDKLKSESLKFDNTTIRTITLTKALWTSQK